MEIYMLSKLTVLIILISLITAFAGKPVPEKSQKREKSTHAAVPQKFTPAGNVSPSELFSENSWNSFREVLGVIVYDASFPDTLVTELRKYEKLKSIAIYDKESTELSPAIGTFENLTSLKIQMKQLKSLPPELNKLKKLSFLTILCPEVKEIDREIIELPYLNRVTIDADLEELPPIPSTIYRLDLTDNRLKRISWYRDEKSKDNFKQEINLHNNPIENLPDSLIHYIWRRNVEIRSSYKIPEIPTRFKMSPYGAYLDPYHREMKLDNSKFTIQWYERVYGPKRDRKRDTLRVQYMYHPTGLPVLNSEKGRHLQHGKFFESAVFPNPTEKRHRIRERMLYLGYEKDTLHCDTSSYRDTVVDRYRENPRQFKIVYRHGELNDSTCFMAETVIDKKSKEPATYNDGTPLIVGDIIVIEKAGEKISLWGKNGSLKLTREEYALSLEEWRTLPEKEKMKLLDSFIKKQR